MAPTHPHTVHGRRQQPEGDGAMTWYVAFFADRDTHLADSLLHGQLVTALCNHKQFRPIAALPGIPPDPEQICLHCKSLQHPQKGTRRSR